MKLRYRTQQGKHYIPQYQLNGQDIWYDFLAKDVNNLLESIAYKLGQLSHPGGYGESQWYYKPSNKEEKEGEMKVFFTAEIFVMAFLGAAKSYFTPQTKEFEI